jgi:3' terminal RNA ribose 2'-O-methyltransferase Hen1
MLLEITNTKPVATDLGYLLHKNPARCHQFEMNFGRAYVFYPEATPERCTAALLLEIDPVGLVRNRRGPAGEGFALEQYVNDRPYVASSFLSVAIAQVFGTALAGNCKQRPELVATPLPLQVRISVAPCRGGEEVLRRLFEPLGYSLKATRHTLDVKFPEWGESAYHTVELEATCTVRELLTHLYVLLPVLDDDKHYWVGDDEVEKLLKHGAGWLSGHPEKELISARYLKHRRNLQREALARLLAEEGGDAIEEIEEGLAKEEAVVEQALSLNEQRLGAVMAALKGCGAARVLDLGCGEGKLLRELLKEKQFGSIVGVDVSHRALERAHARLNFDRLAPRQQERIQLLHGSLMYRDKRLAGFDAATVVEVIEHLDPPRLAAFERVLFEFARPATVILTTPNVEYNAKFPDMDPGRLRHRDHRFEWTRAEFQTWGRRIAERFGYDVRFLAVGPEDAALGAPTQMGLFSVRNGTQAVVGRDVVASEVAGARQR